MVIVRDFRFAVINLAAGRRKFFRFFRHSDRERFFFYDISFFGVFPNVLPDFIEQTVRILFNDLCFSDFQKR